MSVIIWHNPRCSKSRATLGLIEEKGIQPEIRLYLEDSPSATEIGAVLEKLGCGPRDIMRKGEAAYKEQNLGDESLSRQDLIEAMAATPILIERPIVIYGDRAATGRPPEQVLEIL